MYLFTDGKFAAYNSAGAPLSGGKLYTYSAGTTTPLATYTTQAGGTANANPVVLDASGRADVWLSSSSYRMILKDASDVTIWDVDNISNDPLAGLEDGIRDIELMGADPTGVTDATSIIQAALTAAIGGGVVQLPYGTFKITSTLTVGERVHLRGAGKYATKLVFAPSANDTAIEIVNGSSIVNQGSVMDLTLYSDDSTYTKIGIDVIDANSYSIERVTIGGSVAVSGTSYWSGSSSIGIRTRGRQSVSIRDVDMAADRPLVIATNPNSSISIDHFNFHNLYLIANANPCIELLTGVNLTQVSFTGFQALVKGTAGLKWSDTTTSIVSTGLRIENARTEQGTSATDYTVDISHNTGLQDLILDGIACDDARKGVKLRNCSSVSLRNHRHVGTTEALNVDSTVKRINASNCFWQASATATVSGQRYVRSAPLNPNTGPLPPDFYMDESANGDRNEWHDGVISATPITLANDGTAAIGGTSTTAFVAVIGKNDGCALFFLNGSAHTVNEISDPGSIFSTTATTGSSTNVYWSAGNSRYEIENKRGSSLDYVVIPLGSYS